mmetsp:Transcript_40092/g.66781  ORF Transcript_40092/g.66781 Transcript_40092/m.66781 type:complete len:251 (-) Transcript_40092:986-1738(-)
MPVHPARSGAPHFPNHNERQAAGACCPPCVSQQDAPPHHWKPFGASGFCCSPFPPMNSSILAMRSSASLSPLSMACFLASICARIWALSSSVSPGPRMEFHCIIRWAFIMSYMVCPSGLVMISLSSKQSNRKVMAWVSSAVSSGCHTRRISTYRSSSDSLNASCRYEVSINMTSPSFQTFFLSPTLIQAFSPLGIFNPKCAVSTKLVLSVWGLITAPGGILAKNASMIGALEARSRRHVLGNSRVLASSQ